jgi:hypothetical protein
MFRVALSAALLSASGAPSFAAEETGDKKPMTCVCSGSWFYAICLDPNLSEDVGKRMEKVGGRQIQFRGPMGFRSAKADPDGSPCEIARE